MNVLCMGILALFAAIMGGGAIYQLHKIAVRLDNGQQAPPILAVVNTPDGEIIAAQVYGQSWQFMWIAIATTPGAAPERVIHPVIRIHLVDGYASLSLTNDAAWSQRAVGDVFPVDANGVPLIAWYASPEGEPVTLMVSTNLTDWETLATVNVVTDASFVDNDRDWNVGQAYYSIQ